MLLLLISLNAAMTALTLRLLFCRRSVSAERHRRRLLTAVFVFNILVMALAVLRGWPR